MKLRNLLFAAIAAFGLGGEVAHAQSTNPFNPDFAWCATQGAVATRTGTTWGCLTPGTSGQVLRTNGAGANVSWQTVTGSGTVTSVGMTVPGEFGLTGSPITTSGTLAMSWASQTANTLLMAPNGSAGTPSFRAMLAADMPGAGVVTGGVITGTFPALTIGATQVTNGMLAANSVTASKVTNNALTNATLAQMATKTVKSNITGGTANAADNTITAVLDAQLGSTQGTIAYRDSASWLGLAPSAGNILQSNGAGANPSWVAPSAAIPASVGIGHRLTLTSGTPALSSAVASATTIYSTPYESGLLLLWNGSNYVPTNCAETSQLLSDATKSPAAAVAATNYDMFAWNDSGTCRVTRGPAWTNATTRSAGTALSRASNGILSNSVSITNGPAAGFGTYMGTIRTDAGAATVSYSPQAIGSTNCGVSQVPIWNMYNRLEVSMYTTLTATNHTYSSSTTRQYRADTACSVNFLTGLAEDYISARVAGRVAINAQNAGFSMTVGLDAVTQLPASSLFYTGTATGAPTSNSVANGGTAIGEISPQLGYHTINALETGDGTNTVTVADNGSFLLSANYRY